MTTDNRSQIRQVLLITLGLNLLVLLNLLWFLCKVKELKSHGPSVLTFNTFARYFAISYEIFGALFDLGVVIAVDGVATSILTLDSIVSRSVQIHQDADDLVRASTISACSIRSSLVDSTTFAEQLLARLTDGVCDKRRHVSQMSLYII